MFLCAKSDACANHIVFVKGSGRFFSLYHIPAVKGTPVIPYLGQIGYQTIYHKCKFTKCFFAQKAMPAQIILFL